MIFARKRILCFDLDGTLIHSKEAHAESYNLAFEKHKLRRVPNEKLYRLFGVPSKKVIRGCYPSISGRRVAAVSAEQKELLVTKCIGLIQPISEAASVLDILARKYVLALISTNSRADISKLAQAGKIDLKKFRIIIGEDEIARPKPAPDAILKVQEYNSAPIDYMIGDTVYDIRAARAAKVNSIGVLSGVGTLKQLWAEKPTHVIRSVAELQEVL